MIVRLRVEALAEFDNPFDRVPPTWGDWVLTRRSVALTRLSEETSFMPWFNHKRGRGGWSRTEHLRRIRFFVNATEPFFPLNVNQWGGRLRVVDGFHRVAAAIFRNDSWIRAEVVDLPVAEPYLYLEKP